mgnify:CR=1 FL=1
MNWTSLGRVFWIVLLLGVLVLASVGMSGARVASSLRPVDVLVSGVADWASRVVPSSSPYITNQHGMSSPRSWARPGRLIPIAHGHRIETSYSGPPPPLLWTHLSGWRHADGTLIDRTPSQAFWHMTRVAPYTPELFLHVLLFSGAIGYLGVRACGVPGVPSIMRGGVAWGVMLVPVCLMAVLTINSITAGHPDGLYHLLFFALVSMLVWIWFRFGLQGLQHCLLATAISIPLAIMLTALYWPIVTFWAYTDYLVWSRVERLSWVWTNHARMVGMGQALSPTGFSIAAGLMLMHTVFIAWISRYLVNRSVRASIASRGTGARCLRCTHRLDAQMARCTECGEPVPGDDRAVGFVWLVPWVRPTYARARVCRVAVLVIAGVLLCFPLVAGTARALILN